MNDKPAPRLGNYELLVELAAGGMATVYVARQAGAAGFERLVVIKRVHTHLLREPEFHGMFVDEARVASLIRHPNVVSVDDMVESDDELFLVMPYVESVSLDVLLNRAKKQNEKLPPSVAVRIVSDALSGLSAAHNAVDMKGERLDVVHRDISPHNILVGIDGKSRIIDFGIAKASRRITTTSRDIMKGKLAYMSPEQARQQTLDARADLFAAGAVLFETLTGEALFKGEDQADILLAVLIGPIPDLSLKIPGVSAELDAVLHKALEREREQRFQTAADFLEQLDRSLPPAPAREVGALVDRLCRADLEARRSLIRTMLDGNTRPSQIPRLTPTPRIGSDRISSDGRSSSPTSKNDITLTATPPTLPQAILAQRRAQPKRAMLLSVGIIGGALVAGLLFSTLFTTPPPPPATPSPAAPAFIELKVRADSPIESVRADGLQSLEISGDAARLKLTPWTGALIIHAKLSNGAEATARAPENTTNTIKLESIPPAMAAPAPSQAASAPSAPASAAPPSPPAPAAPKTPSQAPKNPGKPKSGDLKPNPFR